MLSGSGFKVGYLIGLSRLIDKDVVPMSLTRVVIILSMD
jgi:hypothetical protein